MQGRPHDRKGKIGVYFCGVCGNNLKSVSIFFFQDISQVYVKLETRVGNST